MKLTSPAFSHEGTIPPAYTCDGSNTAPPLHIRDVPQNAVTLALIMEDPDVPKTIRPDGMWDHWIVWNIPADTANIPEGTTLPGIEGTNTSGNLGYGGPCPPDKEHRYYFTLYALDTTLTLRKGATKKELLHAMHGYILAKTVLMGRYNRKQNQ